jgi:TolB-like protein
MPGQFTLEGILRATNTCVKITALLISAPKPGLLPACRGARDNAKRYFTVGEALVDHHAAAVTSRDDG